MNYNISVLEKSPKKLNFETRRNIILKKNARETDIKKQNNLSKLSSKVKDLENRLNFYKKHQSNFQNERDILLVDKSIEIIEHIILNFDKNIISRGQFNRNISNIEFEF